MQGLKPYVTPAFLMGGAPALLHRFMNTESNLSRLLTRAVAMKNNCATGGKCPLAYARGSLLAGPAFHHCG
jgi:hypothetical protein